MSEAVSHRNGVLHRGTALRGGVNSAAVRSCETVLRIVRTMEAAEVVWVHLVLARRTEDVIPPAALCCFLRTSVIFCIPVVGGANLRVIGCDVMSNCPHNKTLRHGIVAVLFPEMRS